MDVVKLGRRKVNLNDCVSIPTLFWGRNYAEAMESKYSITKQLGRVTSITSQEHFQVTWDLEGDQSTQKLSQVTLEDVATPKQTVQHSTSTASSTTTSTTTNNQICPADVTSTSADSISEDHAMIVEGDLPGENFVLTYNSFDLFLCTLVSRKEGQNVHNKPLGKNEGKFSICEVLSDVKQWPEYDEDRHCEGTFIAWNMADSRSSSMEKNVISGKKEKNKEGKGKKRQAKNPGFTYRNETQKKLLNENESESEDDLSFALVSSGKRGRKQLRNRKETDEDYTDSDSDKENKRENKKQKRNPARAASLKKSIPTAKKFTVVLGATASKLLKSNKRLKSVREKKKGKNDKEQGRKQEEIVESSGTSSSSSDEDEDTPVATKEKIAEQKATWKEGGWNIDPRSSNNRRTELHILDVNIQNELSFFLHFFPTRYFHEVILPATNDYAHTVDPNFKDLTFQEILVFLGLLYSMETYKLPQRRMYWMDMKSSLFPNMNFGQHMSRNRFEEILSYR